MGSSCFENEGEKVVNERGWLLFVFTADDRGVSQFLSGEKTAAQDDEFLRANAQIACALAGEKKHKDGGGDYENRRFLHAKSPPETAGICWRFRLKLEEKQKNL